MSVNFTIYIVLSVSSIHLSVCLSVSFIHVCYVWHLYNVRMVVCLYKCMHASITLSINPSIYPTTYLYICVYAYLSFSPSIYRLFGLPASSDFATACLNAFLLFLLSFSLFLFPFFYPFSFSFFFSLVISERLSASIRAGAKHRQRGREEEEAY